MKIRILAIAFIAALLGACAAPGSKPASHSPSGSPEATVERLSTERWNAMVEKRYMDGYNYYTPGYRSTTPADIFSVRLRSTNVRWDAAEFRSVKCLDANRCTAEFNIDYTVLSPARGVDDVSGEQLIEEDWLNIDGQWYFSPRQDV